jgi:hypothetical protein
MDRQEALRAGATRYNTGKPCKNGHMADRYSRSGACVNCVQANIKKSNAIHVTVGEMINRNSKLIYIFAKESQFPLIKITLDAFISMRFPGVNPEHINSYPFKSVRKEADDTYRVRVRVPLEDVDAMYVYGKQLLAANGPVAPPPPYEP